MIEQKLEIGFKKLSVSAGDIVVLTCPGVVSDELAKLIKEYCEQHLLTGAKCLVLGDGLSASVVKDVPHDLAQAAADNARLRAKLQTCEDYCAELRTALLKRRRAS